MATPEARVSKRTGRLHTAAPGGRPSSWDQWVLLKPISELHKLPLIFILKNFKPTETLKAQTAACSTSFTWSTIWPLVCGHTHVLSEPLKVSYRITSTLWLEHTSPKKKELDLTQEMSHWYTRSQIQSLLRLPNRSHHEVRAAPSQIS